MIWCHNLMRGWNACYFSRRINFSSAICNVTPSKVTLSKQQEKNSENILVRIFQAKYLATQNSFFKNFISCYLFEDKYLQTYNNELKF